MSLPSKVQDTLARSLNNLTVVGDMALQELAQTVPTRQADKLQLLLNKLLERAELEAARPRQLCLRGPTWVLTVLLLLLWMSSTPLRLWMQQAEGWATMILSSLRRILRPLFHLGQLRLQQNDPPPGLASGGHDQSASLGPADDGADPWAGWSAAQIGQADWRSTSGLCGGWLRLRRFGFHARAHTHFGCAPAGQGRGLEDPRG